MPDIPTLEDDPCGRATKLRELRDQIMVGGGVIEMESEQGNGVRRRVRYSAANLERLEAEISAADNKCRVKNGKRPRRYAIGMRGW